MLRVAPLLLLLTACDSTALSLSDPSTLEVAFDPAFLDPNETGTFDVTVEFLGVADPADDSGTTRELLEHDFASCEAHPVEPCDALQLRAITFESNWVLRMTLEATDIGDDSGRYDFSLRIKNAFGTFTGTGAFFVFR